MTGRSECGDTPIIRLGPVVQLCENRGEPQIVVDPRRCVNTVGPGASPDCKGV